MLNTLDAATIQQKLAIVSGKLSNVEAFLKGSYISSARIKNASIIEANIADLSITNAKFADAAVTNAKINDVSATKFTAGTLDAARIAAGSITATKLNVSTLSAIAADVGTMTAGSITGITITGGTIRTNTSGDRAEMTSSPNALILYDGGTARVRFDPEALKLDDRAIHWYDFGTGTFYASYFKSGTSNITLQVGGTADFLIGNGTSGGDISVQAPSDQINVWPGTNGDLYVNGSPKAAIVRTKERGYRALFCLESPEVWLFDFAKDLESIDPLFLEATEGKQNILKTDQGEFLVFAHRKDFGAVRFEHKTVEQFNKNNEFWGKP